MSAAEGVGSFYCFFTWADIKQSSMYLGRGTVRWPCSLLKGPKLTKTLLTMGPLVIWVGLGSVGVDVVTWEKSGLALEYFSSKAHFTSLKGVVNVEEDVDSNVTRHVTAILLSRRKQTKPFVLKSLGCRQAPCGLALSWWSIFIFTLSHSPKLIFALTSNPDKLSTSARAKKHTFKSYSHRFVILRMTSFGYILKDEF
jgi:hypothetical protein